MARATVVPAVVFARQDGAVRMLELLVRCFRKGVTGLHQPMEFQRITGEPDLATVLESQRRLVSLDRLFVSGDRRLVPVCPARESTGSMP